MSNLQKPNQVHLFLSVLYNQKKVAKEGLLQILKNEFGSGIQYANEYFPMKDYYSKEMGLETDLKRFFYFIPLKTDRESLISAKLTCDRLEKESSLEGRRIFNFDPGYISLDQVILSTGKPYSHRVYLQDGVYSELTYRFQGKSFQELEWTYPDYCHEEIKSFFNWCREFHFKS